MNCNLKVSFVNCFGGLLVSALYSIEDLGLINLMQNMIFCCHYMN